MTYVMNKNGFTIIELIVVIFLSSLLLIIAGVTVGRIVTSNLKTEAQNLVTAIIYLQNLSVINNKYNRLVIDFEKNSYYAEEIIYNEDNCIPFSMLIETEETEGKEEREEEIKDKTNSLSVNKITNNLLKERQLEKNVFFRGLITKNHKDEKTEGKGFIIFYPDGTIEKALIYIGSDDENQQYTIETIPFMGTAKVYNKRIEKWRFEKE